MMHPTVHLNGTARGDLQQQNMDAMIAIDAAIAALQRAAPNGRDYYPQGDDSMRRAALEHRDRIARLAAVRDELQTILERLLDGGR